MEMADACLAGLWDGWIIWHWIGDWCMDGWMDGVMDVRLGSVEVG